MSDSEVATQEPTSPVETMATNGAKRGRGRPKKDQNAPKTLKDSKKSATNNGVSETNGSDVEREETLPKKRGRKPRADPLPAPAIKEVKTSGAVKRGRGRPPKKSVRSNGSWSTKSSVAKKGAKRGAKKRGRSESVEDEADPIDDNTGDEEDRPEEEGEEEEDDD